MECEDACEEGQGADDEDTERMKKWSYEEDQVLKNHVEVGGLKWNEIAEKMVGRTYQMCYSRYQRIKREKRRSWSKVEEAKLIELVSAEGKKWKKISELIPGKFALTQGRSAKQVRERYLNHLQPHISQKPWSEEEDRKLLGLVREHGHQWRVIESLFGNRSQNQLKNRFYGRLRLAQ